MSIRPPYKGCLFEKDLVPAERTIECRREPRTVVYRDIEILPTGATLGDTAFRSVTLRDCSLHGMGFVAAFEMTKGDQFLAKLRLEKLMLLLYTVRHCRPSADHLFFIGAEFTRVGASELFQSDYDDILRALLSCSGTG